MTESYKVSLVSTRSCLVNLPQALERSLSSSNVAAQSVVVILRSKSTVGYAGWTGHQSSNSKALEMDPSFAKNLGLTGSSEVLVELKINPREADVIWVEPLSADDWEIMELHASFLELNLLSQIRAVSTAHPLTIYLSPHTTATIVVKKIEPELKDNETFAKIAPTAEVIVSPKTRQVARNGSVASKSVVSTKSRASASAKSTRSIFLRALPAENDKIPGLNAFIPNAILRNTLGVAKYLEIQVIIPAGLRPRATDDIIPPPLPPVSGKETDDSAPKLAKKIVVRAYAVDDVPEGHIRLSAEVMFAVQAQLGSKIRICPAGAPKKITEMSFHRITESSRKKEIKVGGRKNLANVESFKDALTAIGEGPVTHGLRIDNFLCALKENDEWSTVPAIDKLSIKQGEDVFLSSYQEERLDRRELKGVDQVQNTACKVLKRSGGILLYGSRGCGKSAVAAACAVQAEQAQCHTVIADCSKISEERVPVIKEMLNQWFSTAAWYEPSVVFIDDLDRLCPAEVEHADSTRARQLAEIFLSILRSFTSRHRIALLCTAQSREALHSLLTTSHIFDDTISLKPPNKVARREIAQTFVSHEEAEHVDWQEVANITDGYLAGDLRLLTERAKSEALMRQMSELDINGSEGAPLLTDDYQKAIRGFTPASLRGIKLQKSTVEWKDIGGLTDTRQILLETLEWPTRYAPIFANCPLRLRSGLLLYGYPGCGKTLLASAVASECGLNFISVKGPEILNKYIGASEKSVRDLFDRAQAAKPCVLFFDEFDSIAPKRGHDSTGVTDRVVNQMLTQMDGAEGLDGVYVLAATSRPDLIDPALLRPGRLDKSLLCNMPSISDRESILQALSRKMHIAPEVSLTQLAAETEGFTGADLQAVLYNAHLEAIHDVLARKEEEDLVASRDLTSEDRDTVTFTRFTLSDKVSAPKTSAELAVARARVEAILAQDTSARTPSRKQVDGGDAVIAIRWENLQKSLTTTRPSISASERRRLDKVYHDFVDGRSADGLPNGQSAPGEQRATLA